MIDEFLCVVAGCAVGTDVCHWMFKKKVNMVQGQQDSPLKWRSTPAEIVKSDCIKRLNSQRNETKPGSRIGVNTAVTYNMLIKTLNSLHKLQNCLPHIVK